MSSSLREDLEREFQDKEYREIYYEDSLYCHIAMQVASLRKQRGWTQRQLAERIGTKQARISLIEDVNYRGWTLSTLIRLARAFDVALDVGFIGFQQAIDKLVDWEPESLKIEKGYAAPDRAPGG